LRLHTCGEALLLSYVFPRGPLGWLGHGRRGIPAQGPCGLRHFVGSTVCKRQLPLQSSWQPQS
jgi:hypothetical protein